MLRPLILSIILVSVKSDVNEFLGDWTPVVTFPDRDGYTPQCPKFNIRKDDSKKCTCGDKGDALVLKFGAADQPNPVGDPVIIITSSEEVATNIDISCSCNGKSQRPILLRKIKENYMVVNAGSSAEYASTIFVKQMPKLSELKDVFKTVPEVLGKAPGYTCKETDFAKE